jgi:hypothetical protein
VASRIIYWPVGGAKYRLSSHQRFAEHLAFVHQNGLDAVVALVDKGGKAFGTDPRGGPWASVLMHDRAFAEAYAKQNVDQYKLIVASMARTMFDRDTLPGAEPEDLMRLDIPALVVPGRDAAHATSAARYVEECIPDTDYWDVAVADQTEEATAAKLLAFLEKVSTAK